MSNNSKLSQSSVLVVLSGGQDSTTCLYWAFDKFNIPKEKRADLVKTVSFDYGQKHKIELESAEKICRLAAVDYDLVHIPEILRSSSPLVDSNQELDKYEKISDFASGVQPTFVPGRNILFLTLAANLAMHHGIGNIVIGVCEEDFGGYYDCRQDFINAQEKALNQGLLGKDSGIKIHTPLMNLSKAESVKLAASLDSECMEALALSHTCYDGKFPPCGKCHACLLRERGFKEAELEDPLLSRAKILANAA